MPSALITESITHERVPCDSAEQDFDRNANAADEPPPSQEMAFAMMPFGTNITLARRTPAV
ncbi:MAG: hypothetical protein ABI650_08465 [Dokdonella sp.]